MLVFSRSVVCNSLRPHGLQHARLLCLSLSPGVCSDSCPLGQWCHPTISSSVAPISSCPQFFPASGSFPMSQLFASGAQSTGASTSASVLLMNRVDGPRPKARRRPLGDWEIILYSFFPFFSLPSFLSLSFWRGTKVASLWKTTSSYLGHSLAVWYWASLPTSLNLFLTSIKRITCAHNEPNPRANTEKKEKKRNNSPALQRLTRGPNTETSRNA